MTPATSQSVERRCLELRVTIAGITTAIVSREPDLELAVEGPTARFIDIDATPHITIQVAWDPPERTGLGEKLFDSGGVWQLFRDGDLLVFHLRSPKFGLLPYTTAAFSPDFATGAVYLRRSCFDAGLPLYPLEYPLHELLIANWLALGRGVEIHACAVVDADGAGYLFAGHSGAGKTTMARQWCQEKGVTVLSDDRVILRKIDNQIWMHGTPWHGDEPLAARESARLTRGFFLRHLSRNQIAEVGGAQAVARLLACSFPPFFSASGLAFTLSFLTEVSQLTPFSELGFLPDRAVLDFVRSTS